MYYVFELGRHMRAEVASDMRKVSAPISHTFRGSELSE